MPTVKKYQQQKERQEIAYNYFINQGYSPEASAGIVGNLLYESGLNTTARGDIGFIGGDSYGIAQFRGKRLENLKNRYGKNWTDFNNQLDFVKHELETTHQKANKVLRNTNDVYEAGRAFSDLYEIPAKKYKDNKDRQGKVNKVYSSFVGKQYTNSPTPISDQAISNVNTYFQELPTTDVKDLPVSDVITTFDTEENEKVAEDKDIEEVKAQTKEYNFLKEYKSLLDNQQAPQQEIVQQEVIEQQPQQSLTDIYNQVSQFVDTPIFAQQGGATRQDSLNIRNSSINFKNKIKALNYVQFDESDYNEKSRIDNIYEFKNGKVGINSNIPSLKEQIKIETNTRSNGDIYLNSNVPRTGNKKINGKQAAPEVIGYNKPLLKKITPNQYLTAEQSAFMGYNTDIPNLLMDGRIKPQKTVKYSLEDNSKYPDFVIFNEYDPLAVTPFDMLTESEKAQRVKKYGKSGVPESYKKQGGDIEILKNRAKIENLEALKSRGIVDIPDSEFSKTTLINQYIQPKYWEVQDNINQNFGGYQQNYRVYPETADTMLRELAPEPYNTRKSEPIYQQGGSVGNLTPEQTTDVEKQRQWSNYWNSNRVIDGQKINSNSDIPFSSDIYIDDLNYGNGGRETTLGEFDNVSDRLILDTDYQSKPGIPVHEFTHRYQKYLPSETYSKYINQPISSALSNTAGSSEYHGNVDENQAELNRLRYNVGFKPDQVITPQDLQQYNADDYNLKHFSQDQLINLLNTTAYNESQDQSRYAQQGEIVKDQEGQRKYPNRITEIQGNTMSTEGYGNIPLYVVPDIGAPKIVEANTGEHIFPEATKFTEYPLTEQEKEFLKHISKLK